MHCLIPYDLPEGLFITKQCLPGAPLPPLPAAILTQSPDPFLRRSYCDYMHSISSEQLAIQTACQLLLDGRPQADACLVAFECSYCVGNTDSFHGACMSVLMHCRLSVVLQP